DMRSFQLLNDPQTSGGLLISVAADAVHDLVELFREKDLADFVEPIGRMQEQSEFAIYLEA
ncbi:MAG: selenide, water dikinase SelD, partial [Bacteroidia bacterium]